MNKRLRSPGFTLIEVLIAITLLGIMVVLLFSSLRIAAESWDAGESKTIEVNKKAVVYQFFKRQLSGIKPLPMYSDAQQAENTEPPGQAFQGLPQSLRFVSSMPSAAARKGLQLFTVGLDSKEPSTLKVALSPYQQDSPQTPEQVVLLKNVKNFQIRYFGIMDQSDEALWQDEWQETEILPKLIKISITLEDNSFWPDMIFAVKITELYNPEGINGEIPTDSTPPP